MDDTTTAPAAAAKERTDPQYLLVCVSNPLGPEPESSPEADKIQNEHRQFLQDLFDQGILFGSGPQAEENGERHGGAVYILQGVSLEEAKKIIAEEPKIREGQRDVTVYPWRRIKFGG